MSEATLDSHYVWFLILVMGIGTFLIRSSFIQLFGQFDEIPPQLDRVLGFVPVAILAALVFPRLVYVDGELFLWLSNERLIAGSLAAIVAWRTESMLATIGAGMGALWAITIFVS